MPELEGDVVFDDVDFGYTDDKIVLHNIKSVCGSRDRRLRLSAQQEPVRRPSPI